ncbi:MAG: class I SAM-dependent methyltransferase [Bryobacteraceae bacterium]
MKADQITENIRDLVRRVGHGILRRSSTEFLAYSDLFLPPYSEAVDWRSGLGPSLHMLYGLVRTLSPEVVVEIGSARGRSACALALACRQNRKGKVIAIDPHQVNDWSDGGTANETYDFLCERLSRYKLTRWCEVLKMTSAEAFRGWDQPIDLAFIDGDHSYHGVRTDFELCLPFLAKDALVLFHDSAWEHYPEHPAARDNMGVPQFLEELKDRGYHAVTLFSMPGLTVLDPRIGGFQYLPSRSSNSSVTRVSTANA